MYTSLDCKFSDVLKLLIDDIIDDNNLLYLSSFEVNKDKSLLSLFSLFLNIKDTFCSSF